MARSNSAVRLATLAVAIALVCVFTMVVRIPLGAGYLNLCDVAIAFCAYALGPVTALVAGALGPAFADLAGGYAQWALVSCIVHGLEGLLMAGFEDSRCGDLHPHRSGRLLCTFGSVSCRIRSGSRRHPRKPYPERCRRSGGLRAQRSGHQGISTGEVVRLVSREEEP